MAKRKRTNGITLRSDGRWCKTYQGKKHYLGRGSRKEAEHEFEIIKARLALGQPAVPEDEDDPTVSDMCKLYLNSKERDVKQGRFSQRTLTGLRSDLGWMCRLIGSKKARALKGHSFNALVNDFTDLKSSTVNIRVQRVKTLLKWAVDQEYLDVMPRLGDLRPASKAQKRRERSEGGSPVKDWWRGRFSPDASGV